MKKMLSLAAMFAALSYASPAFAELNLGGDSSVRVRNWGGTGSPTADNVAWQYRIRLNAAADLGDGYFFKAMITNEDTKGGGWQTVGYGNTELYNLQVSQFYFGHNSKCDSYAIGRLPLNSFNNPVFDLTLYPNQPFDIPVATINLDRVFGANYGVKIGDGDLKATLVVLDNKVAADTQYSGDGLMNDGYALLASYKFNIGNVTLDPQVLTALTKTDVWDQSLNTIHYGFRPVTVGSNIAFPAGGIKFTASGFYTRGSGTTPNNPTVYPVGSGTKVDYFGDLFRLKGEYGPFMAWYDYNQTTDKSGILGGNHVYTNQFVWAQYKINVHESAKGNFTVQPTFRYLTTKDHNNLVGSDTKGGRLRSELWATVTF
ncbi:MAG: hypothetical protein WCI23_04725 [Chlorobiaceae bacterium]|jgi:hypothetical protein